MNNLELKVVFAAVDKFVRPVKAITGAATEAAKALRDNTARIKELNRSVEQIDAFKKAEKGAAITANTFAKTRRQIDELKAAIDRSGVPTRKQATELAALTRRSEELRQKHQSLTATEQKLFEKLKQSGIDTRNLAEARRQLASASGQASTESRRLQANLDAENQKMRRLRAAQADLAKAKSTAGKLAMAGAGITAAGAAVGLPAARAVNDFRDFETAMLGVARQMDGARDASGKLTADYWDMAAAIKAMSERLPGTANDIAKIVEGGARMGIQGKQNLLTYAETTAVMAKAFDLPVDQVGEDIGQISQLYNIPISDIKSLGDTINWLDDQAQSKGGDIIDVMKRIAGTADMVGMSYKEAAALGSTFLSLGANPEVAASASNAMIRELSVATMQSKRFQGGMAMLGLNSKDVQASMGKDATGTIIKVLEKIKALSGDKQLEAATRLFGKEFGDDAAKLAGKIGEYRRQLELTRDTKAFGSMQREVDAWGETLDGRIENAQDIIRNLSSDLGQHLKPAIADTLESTQSIIQGIRDWAAENPELSKAIMTGVKWLAILLTVMGALTLAAGTVLVPLAMLKLSLTMMGLSGSPLIGMFGKIGAAIGGLKSVIFAAGRILLTNPLFLAIAAIAGLAYLIYRNWEPIKQFFSDLWAGITRTAKLVWEELKSWFSNMATDFKNVGIAIVDGIISGLRSGWSALRDTVVGMADSTIGWVKEKLGIRSPSRVFAEIGAFTMQGFERGILQNDTGPLNALGGVARQLAGIGSAAALSMSPIGIGSAAAAGGNTYHITIQAPAGADEQLLASLVIRAIEQADARKAAARRSRLTDSE